MQKSGQELVKSGISPKLFTSQSAIISPFIAPESVVNTACIVYLANMLAHYENEDIEFYQFDNELLQKFNLTTKEKLDTVSDRLKTAFEKEQDE